MHDDYFYWPEHAERRKIASQIFHKHGWVNCVGHLDGTLFPLHCKPRTNDCGDCHGRKLGYTISGMIASDDFFH